MFMCMFVNHEPCMSSTAKIGTVLGVSIDAIGRISPERRNADD
jgi:hypothetical protein